MIITYTLKDMEELLGRPLKGDPEEDVTQRIRDNLGNDECSQAYWAAFQVCLEDIPRHMNDPELLQDSRDIFSWRLRIGK